MIITGAAWLSTVRVYDVSLIDFTNGRNPLLMLLFCLKYLWFLSYFIFS
jgi:hypothetical protein